MTILTHETEPDVVEILKCRPLATGKTKSIYQHTANPQVVLLVAKDDITAGDGAKHDIIEGKAELATTTTTNVFRLLRAHEIPIAYVSRVSARIFAALKCDMLPYEVVVRRRAYGSYLDRNPTMKKGDKFPKPIVEFFLKTAGKKWIGKTTGIEYPLVKDDPLMILDRENHQIMLYKPCYTAEERKTAPEGGLAGQAPFMLLPFNEVFTHKDELEMFTSMSDTALKTFSVLEEVWEKLKMQLVDFKVEFGIGPNGEILLADVIDNDSWRLLDMSGIDLSKQSYREGEGLNEVTRKYARVSILTESFFFP